jgi:hypothetical protein
MVTTYPTIRKQVTEDAREISQLDDLRTSWVAAYRQKHAEADCWAEGFGAVQHSLDTQERVFRMVEQLVARSVSRPSIFAALRRADAVAQGGLSAAVAGGEAIDTLLGEHGIVASLLPREAFEEELRVPVIDQLRASGFDPIPFDGTDPAAFAWVIFELASRTEAAATQLRCDCHPAFRPIPLGVALDRSSRSLVSGLFPSLLGLSATAA